MIILGIDPGSIICGYGVIERNGATLTAVEYGVVKAKKYGDDFNLRLKEIFLRIRGVIERTSPDGAAIESTFFSKNAQSLIKLSQARAVTILAASLSSVPTSEYSPSEVKKSVVGSGAASKEQVQFMVKNILKIEESPEFFDVTDALAVAICHAARFDSQKKGGKSWKDFIEKNPDKVIKS
jgi:crossover junction endodeoxyribonuclease RuvC